MPAESDDDRLLAINGQLSRLAERQAELERRLERLENGRGPAALPLAEAPATPQPVASRDEARRPGPGLEARMGLTLLNRVGVVTLVLGFAFFFKYAVDNRWIGERGRIALGVAAGLVALAWSDRLRRGGQRVYAQGICGAGIAILYVSFYASVNFYHVLGVGAAFALMTAVTIGSGGLSILHGSPAIAALGLVGGFATPLVLDTGTHSLWFLFSYVLLLDAGALWVARARRWTLVEWMALAGTYGLLLTRSSFPPKPDAATPLMVFTLLFTGLFSLGPARITPAVSFFMALAWASGLWSRGAAAPGAGALFAGIALMLGTLRWFSARPKNLDRLAGWLLVFLLPVWPALLTGHPLTFAWCASCAAIAWLARRSEVLVLGENAALGLLFVLLRLFLVEIDTTGAARFATFAFAAAAFWFSAHQMRELLIGAAAFLAGHATLLWILGDETVAWVRRSVPPENLSSVLSLSISVLIAAYAVVLVGVGVALRSAINRVLGLGLLAAVVLKLYFYDVWQLGRLFRFAAFGGLGALLLLTSYLYSRYREAIRASLPGGTLQSGQKRPES